MNYSYKLDIRPYDTDIKKHYYHIMIPAASRDKRNFVIASCVDKEIIRLKVPAGESRCVCEITHVYPYSKIKDNELTYDLICPKCIKLNNPDKIKFDIIMFKLKGI